MSLLHATSVAFDNGAVLLCGPSGCGKSDLALRLIDEGATLVADDYVYVEREGEVLTARTPPTIAGMIEVRGVGLVQLPYQSTATVRLAVNLVSKDDVDRQPEKKTQTFAGVAIASYDLNAFEVSAAAKVRSAYRLHSGRSNEPNGRYHV